MRIALVHDFLTEYGGAERVLEALHELYPDAPLYTAFFNKSRLGIHKEKFQGWKIKVSWANYIPFFNSYLYSPLRILAPFLWKNFDFSNYDVVISSTNMYFAKNIETGSAVHISYIHTPPRSLYGYVAGRKPSNNLMVKVYTRLVNHFLRIADFEAAQKPDYLIANSKEVQKRIKKFYRRNSEVIYPPVVFPKYLEEKAVYGDYFLVVGRLAFSKRVHIAVKAAKMAGVKLVVVGEGMEMAALKRFEDSKIKFLGHVADDELAKLYRNCRAVLFLAKDEDFGMVPVEAMGYGKPVIAADSGGVRETVDKNSGILISEPVDEEKVAEVLAKFDPARFDSGKIRAKAEKFSKERFKAKIQAFIKKCTQK